MWCVPHMVDLTVQLDDADATPTTVDEVRPLDLQSAVRGTGVGKLWNEFVSRYDYLGSTTLVGAQMRYVVHPRDGRPVGMLGFSTAAWKLAPRDSFIGWTLQKGEKTPPFVVDNRSFLMLPWIVIPNLGPHILAIVRRRLPEDRTEHHNTTPVLIKTFVETPRHRKPFTEHPAGSMSGPPADADAGATTGKWSSTSPRKTPDSVLCVLREKIGSEP